jgi:hypothetical protein
MDIKELRAEISDLAEDMNRSQLIAMYFMAAVMTGKIDDLEIAS